MINKMIYNAQLNSLKKVESSLKNCIKQITSSFFFNHKLFLQRGSISKISAKN